MRINTFRSTQETFTMIRYVPNSSLRLFIVVVDRIFEMTMSVVHVLKQQWNCSQVLTLVGFSVGQNSSIIRSILYWFYSIPSTITPRKVKTSIETDFMLTVY